MKWYKSPQHPHEWFDLVCKVFFWIKVLATALACVLVFFWFLGLVLAHGECTVIALVAAISVNVFYNNRKGK